MEIQSKHINGEGLAKLYRFLVGELSTLVPGATDQDRLNNLTESELVFHSGKFGVKYDSRTVWLNDIETINSINTIAALLAYDTVADARSINKVIPLTSLKNLFAELNALIANNYYGPWNNTAQAVANIPIGDRTRGLTFGVKTILGLEEWWWPGATFNDGDIVIKIADVLPIKPYVGDQFLTPTSTSGNFQNTGITLSANPYPGARIETFINGEKVPIGDGVKTSYGYFSGDSGVTAKFFSSLVAGDSYYYNGLISHIGNLDTDDSISINYSVLI